VNEQLYKEEERRGGCGGASRPIQAGSGVRRAVSVGKIGRDLGTRQKIVTEKQTKKKASFRGRRSVHGSSSCREWDQREIRVKQREGKKREEEKGGPGRKAGFC